MKPTKPTDTPKRLRLRKEKVKLLQAKQLDDVAGGGCPPCPNTYGNKTTV
jgi:hypothetical protein